MTQYLILCRSLTHAQRAARTLERAGITATVIRAPQGLSSSGCAHGVILRKRLVEAVRILDQNRLSYGKLYQRGPDGSYEEVRP